jgi:hypothetical protein
VAGLDDTVYCFEDRGGIGSGNGLNYVVEQRCVGVAEEGHGELIVKAVGSGAGHELVQHGQ